MSKFCENCGTEMQDTDVKCPNCGAEVKTETVVEKVVEEVKTNTEPAKETTTTKASKSSMDTKTYAILGGIAAAVVLLLIIIVALFSGGGYKKPIDNMIKGMQNCNAKTYLKAYPEVMREDYEDYVTNKSLRSMLESFEDDYGKNIKISYKILDKEKIEKKDLTKVQEDLEDEYPDAKKNKIKVTAGYKLTVKMTIKGKDDKDTDTTTIKVYKVGGKWCMISSVGL